MLQALIFSAWSILLGISVMMKKYLYPLVLGCSLLGLTPAFAQQTPEQVTAAYLDAANKSSLAETAGYFHPDELNKFKSAFITLFESSGDQELVQMFFGEQAALAELKAMPAEPFARKMLGAIGKLMKSEDIHFTQSKIVGSVKEGDAIHLLVRQYASVENIEFNSMQIVTLKPYQDSYKLMFSDKLDGMIKGLQAGLAKKR